MTHRSFSCLSSMGMFPLTTFFCLFTLSLNLRLWHHLALTLIRLMELVYSVKWCISFSCLRISVIKIKWLLISKVKGFNSLTHSSLFLNTWWLSTLIFFIIALHLLMDLQHYLIIWTIWFMLTTFSSLSLSIIVWLCSSWWRLLDVRIQVLLLILSINDKFIINLLSRRYIDSILLLIRSMDFMRSPLVSILSLREFGREIFFILLLSLVKLHFHILLKSSYRFVAFMMLVCRNWDLVRLLNYSMGLLVLVNSIFLRIASFVTSQIYLFELVINFIVFNNFSYDFSNIFLVC